MSNGYLIINVYVDTIAQPVKNAEVHITGEGIDIREKTDENGQTRKIELPAPNPAYSETEQHNVRPYSVYTVEVTQVGLVPTTIEGVEVYPETTSTQDVYLYSTEESNQDENVVVLEPPTLWGDYAPKLPDEAPTSTITPAVLKNVIIPEYIIVHDGVPSSSSSPNYYVSFPDYVKNVASSEIYSTWPRETIKSNVLSIISFALNRYYTEWYLGKGYNFTITSTTSYDQKYTPGRTIFDSISNVVDEIFNQYIRIGINKQPYLAHYKANTSEKGWLSQWGSKDLGDRGYDALQILRYYYGNNANIDTAPLSGDYPTSFPGYNLKLGSCGEEVQTIQNQLNFIRGSYPGIPIIQNANGEFKADTEASIRKFQSVFSLPVTGIVDFATWYKISYIYTAVSNMAKNIYS